MQRVTNQALFQHLDKTMASVLFEENTYPWEVLPKIHDFILEVGMLLWTSALGAGEEYYQGHRLTSCFPFQPS